MSPPRRKYLRFIVLMLIFAFVISACGGDDDEEPTPTPRNFFPSVTPINTVIAGVSSPTPLPTFPNNFPTFTPFRYPTVGQAATLPSSLPNNIQITSPATNGILRGNLTIFGSASHPDFVQYALEYGPESNPNNLWYPITPQAVTVAVLNGGLGAWNTTLVPDGFYQIRLHVYLTGGREITNVVVRNLRVANTSLPTPTSPATNNPPVVSPVPAFKMIKGTTATVAVGIYDPNGDTVNFSVWSDNRNVVTVTRSGQAIVVTAHNAGVATVNILATDARGAQTSSRFIVTVENPPAANNPPNINPIPGQTLQQGTVINIPLIITDPDGDTVNFTASSAAPNIVTVNKGAGTSINLSAVAQGSTTVSITATDARGAARTAIFSVVVNPPSAANNPPSIGAITSQNMDINTERDIALSVSDPDGDTLSVTASSSDNAIVSIVSGSATSVRVRGVGEGSANITVTVTDGRGGSANTVFSVTVNVPPPPNENPTISTIDAQVIEVGQTVNIDLSMSDPDGDTVNFTATSADDGVAVVGAVDVDTLSLAGTGEGSAVITVIVSDGNGGSAQTTFNVTVNAAQQPNQNPTIGTLPNQTLEVGQNTTVNVTTNDPDGDPVSVNVSSDNGGVATASYDAGVITINAVGAGSATITVDANDGRGGTAQATFSVTVNEPAPVNNSPTVDPIAAQVLEVGQNTNVSVLFGDVDGDPLTVTASSDNDGVVTASFDGGTNTVALSGIAAGSATVTVTVDDGKGGTAQASFGVTVNEPAPTNQNPTIDPIAAQSVDVNASINVAINASDPDGDPLTITASSDNNGIATASWDGANVVVVGLAAGNANVTVNVDDGKGGTAQATFGVTVNEPAPTNQDPVYGGAPIDTQALETGQAGNVAVSFTDPDGDALTITAVSSDNNVVTATYDPNTGTVQIVATGEGSATVTVTADDGNGGTTSTSFNVNVSAPAPVNQAPTIAPIDPQTVDAGSSVNVAVIASDPDGDVLTITAASDNETIATAVYDGVNVVVSGVAGGSATITVTADDGKGGVAAVTFGVTVNAAAPVFDVSVYPEIPALDGQTLNAINDNGVANFGRRNIVFAVAGDDPVNSSNYLDSIADGNYNLGTYGGLQTTIDHYNGVAHEAAGDTALSWNVASAATGNGWNINTLLDPNASGANCNAGETPFACELRLTSPSVVIISFSPTNATAVPLNDFDTKLREATMIAINSGVIPVLTTLPDDGTVDATTLAQYNEVIYNVANDNKVPMLNLYVTMQGASAGVYATGGASPNDFSDGALTAGNNRRNLATLRVLEDIRAQILQ